MTPTTARWCRWGQVQVPQPARCHHCGAGVQRGVRQHPGGGGGGGQQPGRQHSRQGSHSLHISTSKIQQIKLTIENQTSNMLKPERLVPVCGGARGGAECPERGPLLQLHQQQGEAASDQCQCDRASLGPGCAAGHAGPRHRGVTALQPLLHRLGREAGTGRNLGSGRQRSWKRTIAKVRFQL